MKNQNDLIISIVCGVLALGGVATLYFTKRDPKTPTAAPKPVLTAPAVPTVAVARANSLPGGGSAPGGVGSFAGGRRGGGPSGIPTGAPGGIPIGAPIGGVPTGAPGAPSGKVPGQMPQLGTAK
jgi:hypothetical protein